MIENSDLLNKIEEWKCELINNEKHIHFAFLESFIEFEIFLTTAFIKYALGKESKDNFKPICRIEFTDKEHIEGLLKCDKKYIDYLKKIQEIRE